MIPAQTGTCPQHNVAGLSFRVFHRSLLSDLRVLYGLVEGGVRLTLPYGVDPLPPVCMAIAGFLFLPSPNAAALLMYPPSLPDETPAAPPERPGSRGRRAGGRSSKARSRRRR